MDANTGAPLGPPIQAHDGEYAVRRLVATEATDPPQLITVGTGTVVRRWDAHTGRLLDETSRATAAAVVVRVDRTTVIALGGPDGSITVVPLPTPGARA